MIIKKSAKIGNKEISIETGRVAKQASGAVTVQCGDTVVLVTVVATNEVREGIDFFPLSVEYREKSYAAGKIPGGFFKREGRPGDKEILAARLIDRPIRPLFPEDFKNETQVIASIISVDNENDADVLAGIGASAALSISDIPFEGPISTVRVAQVNDTLIINPTFKELENFDLEFIVSGSEDSIIMVEGEAKEVSEEALLKAIEFAHIEIKKIIEVQKELINEAGVEKREFTKSEVSEGLIEKIDSLSRKKIKNSIRIKEKKERHSELNVVQDEVIVNLSDEFPDSEQLIKNIFHDIEKEETRNMMLDESIRLDGRKSDEIRPITCEIGYLPRTHGSALFTRGQTQALGTTTLGTKMDEQLIDGLEGTSYKTYMLHYNFPPFSTGEAKPIRGTNRREIGHGDLAERALKPVLPGEDKFPYTIRVVSDILESNGSSSMASVCAGSLSLMDAGVPVRSNVAGIAMGLIKEDKKTMILSDILGDEDHLGDMDFKVAGTNEGITAIQMDIKIKGISFKIMKDALEKAKQGRKHILEIMNNTIAEARKELSKYAPRILTYTIPVDKIGAVIGPSGKTIKSIIEKTNSTIDISDEGVVFIASTDMNSAEAALKTIKSITVDPEVGQHIKGIVKRITNFGAFVEFAPGKEGMIHISEMDVQRTNKITDIANVGDTIEALIKTIDREGKIGLSRKALLIKNKK
jgi:polyribonucleotide nucleotidyltransferase